MINEQEIKKLQEIYEQIIINEQIDLLLKDNSISEEEKSKGQWVRTLIGLGVLEKDKKTGKLKKTGKKVSDKEVIAAMKSKKGKPEKNDKKPEKNDKKPEKKDDKKEKEKKIKMEKIKKKISRIKDDIYSGRGGYRGGGRHKWYPKSREKKDLERIEKLEKELKDMG